MIIRSYVSFRDKLCYYIGFLEVVKDTIFVNVEWSSSSSLIKRAIYVYFMRQDDGDDYDDDDDDGTREKIVRADIKSLKRSIWPPDQLYCTRCVTGMHLEAMQGRGRFLARLLFLFLKGCNIFAFHLFLMACGLLFYICIFFCL